MAFSKTFPKTIPGIAYPKWEEVYLNDEEEVEEEKATRDENIKLMKECIEDSKAICKEIGMKNYQTDIISIAIALFEKRASHIVFHKESRAKEKFDEQHKKK